MPGSKPKSFHDQNSTQLFDNTLWREWTCKNWKLASCSANLFVQHMDLKTCLVSTETSFMVLAMTHRKKTIAYMPSYNIVLAFVVLSRPQALVLHDSWKLGMTWEHWKIEVTKTNCLKMWNQELYFHWCALVSTNPNDKSRYWGLTLICLQFVCATTSTCMHPHNCWPGNKRQIQKRGLTSETCCVCFLYKYFPHTFLLFPQIFQILLQSSMHFRSFVTKNCVYRAVTHDTHIVQLVLSIAHK